MNVLKKINKLRIERGWSVYRLSVESGITQSTLTNMFNRETQPSISTLEALCGAFGITMAEFFSEDGESRLSAAELELLGYFRCMTPEARQSVLTLMKEATHG
ncbi:MAG: helix-turn-helix transcriptional regulator [Clostridia bacterium]|nr:helix-turn-helix transcriptional regulator [Clostridia bacterium]MBR3680438.1 helix-turn-helix transcriptional regulator [Clostridia bacterium]